MRQFRMLAWYLIRAVLQDSRQVRLSVRLSIVPLFEDVAKFAAGRRYGTFTPVKFHRYWPRTKNLASIFVYPTQLLSSPTTLPTLIALYTKYRVQTTPSRLSRSSSRQYSNYSSASVGLRYIPGVWKEILALD